MNDIGDLKRGDKIVIKKGCGTPEVSEDTEDIIAAVGGHSALTAKGIRLCCLEGGGVAPTGEHVDNFELSQEAEKILEEVAAVRKIIL